MKTKSQNETKSDFEMRNAERRKTSTLLLKRKAPGFSFCILHSAFCILLLILPGCSLIGAVADKTAGGQQEPAKFEPNKLQSMVVVAENWSNPSDSDVETEQLARFVFNELQDHKVAPQIDPMRVIDLRSQDPEKFRAMTIPQIGQWAGARQVLYINETDNALSAPIGSQTVAGGCTARVKLIDVASGQTTWPPDLASGYPITVETPAVPDGKETDEATVRQALQKVVAERIARLFYKHDVEDDEAGEEEMQ
jgi:hypothetical protein